MEVQQFYEKMYGNCQTHSLRLGFLYKKLRRFELNRYELAYRLCPGGNRLLEVGCGDGELLIRLRDKYQELWGIDIAQPRIERIQKYKNIHVRVEDANKQLNFQDGYFDTVIAIAVLEHFFDPYHFIKECYRLLTIDGALVVQVPNVAFLPNKIRLLFGKLPVTSNATLGWDGGRLHYFTRSALKGLFKMEDSEW